MTGMHRNKRRRSGMNGVYFTYGILKRTPPVAAGWRVFDECKQSHKPALCRGQGKPRIWRRVRRPEYELYIHGVVSYLLFVNVFGIDPAIVATMLFIEGIWDAVNDPIMGSIVDKTRTRFGKLRPYLLVIPIPLAVVTMLLFAGPVLMAEATMGAKVVYMVITYFVWEFLYTICDVPFWGMSAAISPNPADRTRAISSARFTASILGGLPGIVLPVLIDLINAGAVNVSLQKVFFVIGIVVSFVGMGLFSLAGICTRERVAQSLEEPSLLDSFKYLFQNKPLMLLILSNILGALGGINGIFKLLFH